MLVKYNSVYAIKTMSAVLNGSAPVIPSAEINWYSFKAFCDNHSISNIVAYGINSLECDMPKEIKAYFNEIVLQSIAKEARLEVEINDLIGDLEVSGIPHMLLKGAIIKSFYPQPDMRSMCDVDILVGNNLDKAAKIMSSHGYELKSKEFLHDTYFKKPFINIELHSSLFDKQLNQLYDYFKVGFERATNVNGFECRYELKKEDLYLFILAHLAKHFKNMGTGIRSIADIYVFITNNQDLDFEYINTEAAKIGLLKFSERIKTIAFNWFEDGNVNLNDSVESYILSSGTYGSYLNLELNKFLQNGNSGSYSANKLKYFFRVVFPDLDYMCARYSKLHKYPVLLPFYWIKRIFFTFFRSKGSIKYRLERVAKSDKSSLDKFSDFD